MKLKNLTAAVSALAVMLSAGMFNITAFAEEDSSTDVSSSESEADVKTSGDYAYSINTEDDEYHYDGEYVENSIRIVAYTGSDTDVVIPDEIDGYTVTAIAEDAFADCTAKTLTIPSELNYLGGNVFFNMTECTEYKTGSNKNYTARDGVLMSSDGTSLYAYPIAKTETSYVVPNDVTYIGPSAFAYSKLTDVTLPKSLTKIDEWAFAYSGLTKLDMPSSLEDIEQFAFAYCENLSDVDFSNSLTYIGSAAFACCKSIASVDLPTSLTEVGQTAFLGTGLTEVRIPASVTSIGYCAFGYDEDFKAVNKFIIYGVKTSQAESYATEKDEENDYENNFTFIADQEETVAEEKSGVSLSTKMIITIVLISVIVIAAIALCAVLIIGKISGKGKKK